MSDLLDPDQILQSQCGGCHHRDYTVCGNSKLFWSHTKSPISFEIITRCSLENGFVARVPLSPVTQNSEFENPEYASW